MIVHLFNSSSVSGPERLVLPALAKYREQFMIVNLLEYRIARLNESDPLKDFAVSLNLPYRTVKVRSRWDRGAIRELQRLLDQFKPDLVHAHAIKASVYLLQTRRNGRLGKIPFVSTHHGVHGLPDWKVRLYEWLYRKHFLKSYDRVLCVSQADYQDVLNSGIAKEKLRLHLNGIDARFVAIEDRPKEAQKARALWLPDEIDRDRFFLFGVIGRLSWEKNHARLLRVLSRLNNLPCERGWKCLIFGMGPLESRLSRQARRLRLEQRVHWMGYRKDVANELAGLDLVLSFSKAEGMPINLIEAGWAGTPVMSTQVGGAIELLLDEGHGTLVPPDEPVAESARRIQKLLTSEGQIRLRDQAKRFQERVTNKFTQERWIQRLAEIYSEMSVRFQKENDNPQLMVL